VVVYEKGTILRKMQFLAVFKLSPFQGHKSPRLLAWFLHSLGLLLHNSNVRSWSKPPVPNGELPNWGNSIPHPLLVWLGKCTSQSCL